MLNTETQDDLKALTGLFERTRRGDLDARALLKDWFDSRTAAMREGKQARQELGMLAYLVAEKEAARKLAPGGKFDDLPNDPSSVASRHWERFQPFCEDVESGKAKTVDEFVIRVNALVKFVLVDMANERNKASEHELPLIEGVDPEDCVEGDEPFEDYPEWLEQKRALLQRIFQVLPPRQFIVVILKDYCGFQWRQIADILGTTVYYVQNDHAKAIRLIGQNMA